MIKLLVQHATHIVFVAIGVGAFLWTAYRQPADRAEPRREPPRPPARPAPTAVRRPVARRGLLALGPLLGALATGAVLYGVNLGGSPPPGSLIWVHSGVSLLALVLVVYKLGALRRGAIRRGLAGQRLPAMISVALGALSVPLLITGIALVVAPGGGSFAAYSHLVASAWWTALLVWHLRRYVGASLRALAAPGEAALEAS